MKKRQLTKKKNKAFVFLYTSLLSKVRHITETQSSKRSLITNHGITGTAFLLMVLLHTPTKIVLIAVIISATCLATGTLSWDSRALPVKIHAFEDTREVEDPNGKLRVISCNIENATITDEQGCYFKVNGKYVGAAWTNSVGDASFSTVTLVLNLGPGEEYHITGGPFTSFQSRYALYPKRLWIYCSSKKFFKAHALLHEREKRREERQMILRHNTETDENEREKNEHENDLDTQIVWVGPEEWLLNRFDRDHDCPYRQCIHVVPKARAESLGVAQLESRDDPLLYYSSDIPGDSAMITYAAARAADNGTTV